MKLLPEKKKVLLLSLVALAGAAALGLQYLIYRFLAVLTTRVVSLLIILAVYYLNVRLLIRCLTFPGSVKLFQRNMEFQFCKSMAQEVRRACIQLKNTLEMFQGQAQDSERTELLHSACKKMKSLIHSFEAQMEAQREGSLTVYPDQERFLKKLTLVRTIMADMRVGFGDVTLTTAWDFPSCEISLKHAIEDCVAVVPEGERKKLNALIDAIVEVEDHCQRILVTVPLRERLSRWFKEKTFGTLEQMRVDLELRYRAEHLTLTAADRTQISCFWIPSANARYAEEVEEHDSLTDDNMMAPKAANTDPTMVFCNPNAGYAELCYYQSDWVDYYVNSGINVVVWNYRGFGLSGGRPSPQALKEDAELVAVFARQKSSNPKLGVHGQSLGGIIAAHLARKGLVDFCFVDRTFSDLGEVAGRGPFGMWVKPVIKLFTLWGSTDSTSDFIYANCYKVIGCDPKDEIIHDLASIKSGVSLRIIENELQLRKLETTLAMSLTTSTVTDSEDEKSNLQLKKVLSRKDIEIQDYFHVLNKEETKILYTSFQEIYNIIFDMDLHNKKLRKRAVNAILTARQGQVNQSAYNTPMETTASLNQMLSSTHSSEYLSNQNKVTDLEGSYLLTEIETSTSRDMSPNSSALNTSTNFRPPRKRALKSQVLREKEVKYRQQEGDSKTDFSDYVEFLVNFFKQIEKLDSSGRTLSAVFSDIKRNRFQSFRLWIINLDIWGSFFPLTPQCYDIQLTRTASYTKLQQIRRYIKAIIREKRANEDYYGPLMTKLLTQCELIDYYFSKIEQYLYKKHQNILRRSTQSCADSVAESVYSSSPRSDRIPTLEEEDKSGDLETGDFEKKANVTPSFSAAVVFDENVSPNKRPSPEKKLTSHGTLDSIMQGHGELGGGLSARIGTNVIDFEEDSVLFRDFTEPDLMKTGYLIPVTCGHNGLYGPNEKTVYEIHLTNAGFIQEQDDHHRSSEYDES